MSRCIGSTLKLLRKSIASGNTLLNSLAARFSAACRALVLLASRQRRGQEALKLSGIDGSDRVRNGGMNEHPNLPQRLAKAIDNTRPHY
jgi:hypothetical protein